MLAQPALTHSVNGPRAFTTVRTPIEHPAKPGALKFISGKGRRKRRRVASGFEEILDENGA